MPGGQRPGRRFASTLPTRVVLVRVQRLEPFIALMLIRQRLPLMDTTGGGQHLALGAAVMALPSGLLAMVCAAMLKLESKLDVRPSFFGRCAVCPHCTPHAIRCSRIARRGGLPRCECVCSDPRR